MAIGFCSLNVRLCACLYCAPSYTLLILPCGGPVVCARHRTPNTRGRDPKQGSCEGTRAGSRQTYGLRAALNLLSFSFFPLPLCQPTLWHPPFVHLSLFSPLHAPVPFVPAFISSHPSPSICPLYLLANVLGKQRHLFLCHAG